MKLMLFSLLVLFTANSFSSIDLPLYVHDEHLESEEGLNVKSQRTQATLRKTERVDLSIFPHYNNFLYVPIKLGNPPQEIKLRLRMKDTFIWVSNQRGYDITLSSSGQNSTEVISLPSLGGKNAVVTRDDMRVGDAVMNSFSFLVVYERTGVEDMGNLGLGKTDKQHKHLNFIDTLHERHLITKKVFYIRITDSIRTLSIGEYPPEVDKEENQLYFHMHKIVYSSTRQDQEKITTPLSAVFIEGESKLWEVNDAISFSYGANFISVSWAFFDHLKLNFFKEDLDENICQLIEMNLLYEYILCSTSKMRPKGAISFILGDWSYKFDKDDYLLKDKENDSRMIAFIKNRKFNGWSFGYHFYRKYLTVFDYEVNQIGIYYHPQ